VVVAPTLAGSHFAKLIWRITLVGQRRTANGSFANQTRVINSSGSTASFFALP
jgi:hypothetical protein